MEVPDHTRNRAKPHIGSNVVRVATNASTTSNNSSYPILCSQDSVAQTICPVDAPVCCRWPVNGVFGVCCPEGSVCSIKVGYCIRNQDGTALNASQASAASGNVNASETLGPLLGGSAYFSLPVTYFIIFCSLGVALLLGLSVTFGILGWRVEIWYRGWQQLRSEAAEAEADMLTLQETTDNESVTSSNGCVEQLEDSQLCTICYSHRLNCVLMPCGHVVSCYTCAGRLTQCPMCRAVVKTPKKLTGKLFANLKKHVEPEAVLEEDDSYDEVEEEMKRIKILRQMDWGYESCRNRLHAFYRTQFPGKAHFADIVLERMAGRERDIFYMLAQQCQFPLLYVMGLDSERTRGRPKRGQGVAAANPTGANEHAMAPQTDLLLYGSTYPPAIFPPVRYYPRTTNDIDNFRTILTSFYHVHNVKKLATLERDILARGIGREMQLLEALASQYDVTLEYIMDAYAKPNIDLEKLAAERAERKDEMQKKWQNRMMRAVDDNETSFSEDDDSPADDADTDNESSATDGENARGNTNNNCVSDDKNKMDAESRKTALLKELGRDLNAFKYQFAAEHKMLPLKEDYMSVPDVARKLVLWKKLTDAKKAQGAEDQPDAKNHPERAVESDPAPLDEAQKKNDDEEGHAAEVSSAAASVPMEAEHRLPEEAQAES